MIECDRHQHVDDALCHILRPIGELMKLERRGAITLPVSRHKDSGTQMSGRKASEVPFTAPEVVAEIGHWLAHLGAERRMSGKTLDAYDRDIRQFLAFLAGHFGGRVTLARLRDLATRDVRAFMAHRRGQGIGGRSLMRGLAGARSFARFLERQAWLVRRVAVS